MNNTIGANKNSSNMKVPPSSNTASAVDDTAQKEKGKSEEDTNRQNNTLVDYQVIPTVAAATHSISSPRTEADQRANKLASLIRRQKQRQNQNLRSMQIGQAIAATESVNFGSNVDFAVAAVSMRSNNSERPGQHHFSTAAASIPSMIDNRQDLRHLEQQLRHVNQQGRQNINEAKVDTSMPPVSWQSNNALNRMLMLSQLQTNQNALQLRNRQYYGSHSRINDEILSETLHYTEPRSRNFNLSPTNMQFSPHSQMTMTADELWRARDALIAQERMLLRLPAESEVVNYLQNMEANRNLAHLVRQEEALRLERTREYRWDRHIHNSSIIHGLIQQNTAPLSNDAITRAPQFLDSLRPSMNNDIGIGTPTSNSLDLISSNRIRVQSQGNNLESLSTRRTITESNEPQIRRTAAPIDPLTISQSSVITAMTVQVHSDTDEFHLSKYQCLIRKQLQFFASRPEDATFSVQGRKKQIQVGQVGIQCRHCSHLPHRLRGRGAIYYPVKLSGVYQVVQNMATVHLNQHCNEISTEIRGELRALRGNRDDSATGGGKYYWTSKCTDIGLEEYEEGLFFKNLRRK